MQCGFPKDGSLPDFSLYSVPVRDDSSYEFTCRRGHKTTTVVQEQKFEILFEIALNAIADGYYREAVASATSSLERFYEFFARAVSLTHKIQGLDFEQVWKHVKSMSERQLGMFIFAHLIHFRKAPALMPPTRVAFRNDVIHKGRIPLKEEAIEYVDCVLNLITPLLLEAKTTMADSVGALVFEHLRDCKTSTSQFPHSTMSIGSTLSIATGVTEPHPTSIIDSLQRIESKKYRG
jgi:hypothetical protein